MFAVATLGSTVIVVSPEERHIVSGGIFNSSQIPACIASLYTYISRTRSAFIGLPCGEQSQLTCLLEPEAAKPAQTPAHLQWIACCSSGASGGACTRFYSYALAAYLVGRQLMRR